MASPVTSAAMADLLDPRFKEYTQTEFLAIPDKIPMLYGAETSDRADERFSDITPMGDIPEFTGTVTYDGPDQGYDVTATHKEFVGGIQIERKLYDDDQTGSVVRNMFEELGRSAGKTRQKHGARIFNQSFANDTYFYSHSENVALCSNSHTTTRSGVSTASGFDNVGTAALSATSLAAAITSFRQLRDLAGEPIDEAADELWIPVDLDLTAEELIKTKVGLDEASQTKNVLEGKFQIHEWARITDTNDWWICNSRLRKKFIKWIERVPMETGKMEAFDQYIAKGRLYMRYSAVRTLWQWIYGHQVT